MRSGYIYVDTGRSRYAGYLGHYWPSTATSNIWGSAGLGVYDLDFNATGVDPSSGPTNRWLGFPLRCLLTIYVKNAKMSTFAWKIDENQANVHYIGGSVVQKFRRGKMIEVISIIGEVIHDFTGKFLFLGAICAIVFGIWDFSSAKRRWRNRRHYSNDYSSFVWPGEKFPGYYSSFFGVIRCLLLAFAAFAATFMAAAIAAAALALTLLGCDLWFCIMVFSAMIIVASCTGYFSQCSLEKAENQMLECIEVMSIPRSVHRRLRRVRRPVLSRMRFMR